MAFGDGRKRELLTVVAGYRRREFGSAWSVVCIHGGFFRGASASGRGLEKGWRRTTDFMAGV